MSANLPKHIAIVMDGNGRWAKQHNLPRFAGHRAGLKAVHRIVELCCEKQISTLTLFAFGEENWKRPQKEVGHLLNLFMRVLRDDITKLHAQNIQLRIIGDRDRFDEKIQQYIVRAEQLTKDNTGMKLLIAASYSGQWDILQAVKQIAANAMDGNIVPAQITREYFASQLATGDIAPPDLFIRTSGELRISNFLLWQLAYCELYFSDIYWPDFDERHFELALLSYAKRQRRFGCTSEQLQSKESSHA